MLASDLSPPPVRVDLALFLDFDGTLAELAPRPDDARLGEPARAALARIADVLPGRVAIVSGRSIEALDALLGDRLAQRLVLAGSHGVERRLPGRAAHRPAAPATLAAAIRELAEAAATHGLLLERKALGAALHYRAVPDRAAAAHRAAAAIAARHGLVCQTGKMVAEVRVAGDKGDAVAWRMAAPALAGAAPVMIGDDDTDEAGFRAADALGGFGVLVGEPRETAARHRLADVDAVIGWLGRVAAAARG